MERMMNILALTLLLGATQGLTACEVDLHDHHHGHDHEWYDHGHDHDHDHDHDHH